MVQYLLGLIQLQALQSAFLPLDHPSFSQLLHQNDVTVNGKAKGKRSDPMLRVLRVWASLSRSVASFDIFHVKAR